MVKSKDSGDIQLCSNPGPPTCQSEQGTQCHCASVSPSVKQGSNNAYRTEMFRRLT